MYHRLTTSGSYNVRASCLGYFSEIKNVTVGTAWQQLDFALVADVSAVQPAAELPWLQTIHPLGSDQSVRLMLPAGMPSATVDLFDLRGHRVGVLGRGLEAGQSHEMKLPGNIAGGVYLVRVVSGNQQQSRRITIIR
jgi:hypothetical protein